MTKAGMALAMALAAGGAAADGPREGRGGPGRVDAMFEALDANGDGRIDRAEAEAHARLGLDPAAGPVDAAAFAAAVQARAAERAAARAAREFAALDRDGDGRLDADELARRGERTGRIFDRLDADGDGAVTRAEAERVRRDRGDRHDRRG